MKIKITAVALALITALSVFTFSSCNDNSEYPVKVNGITINEEPENVVALTKNCADIISCMDYDDKLAGRADEVNQKGMHVVPSVGSASNISLNKIKELKADVVFADETLNADTVNKLKNSGITVITFNNAENEKQLKELYIKFGTILGGKKKGKNKAEAASKELLKNLRNMKDTVTKKDTPVNMCYIYLENGKLKTLKNGSWGAGMLEYTGETNVFRNEKSDKVNLKKLLLSNPDYIFCSDRKVAKVLRGSKKLKKLSALKSGLRAVPYDEITMQGETSLLALKKMLKKMYPEDFK